MMEETRYAYLRPAEIVGRRTACPVVYIPLGTLEEAAAAVVREVRRRVEDPEFYKNHGMSLQEG
jgi:hypothetical protein